MTYYIDPGTTKGSAVARSLGSLGLVGLGMFQGAAPVKTWGSTFAHPEPVYWEKPQLYPDEFRKSGTAVVIAKANDLIELAASGAATATALAGTCPCIAKRPREWKGQVPKPIQHARVLSRLQTAELALLTTAYGKPLETLTEYIRSAAVRVGKGQGLTGYSAQIVDLLDAVAFMLVIEGRL